MKPRCWNIKLSASVKSTQAVDCTGLSLEPNRIFSGFTSRDAAVAWVLRSWDARIVDTVDALSNDESTCFICEVCRYCGQDLFEPDGSFECGGEGEGICSFWCAIGDYQSAGQPTPLEAWLDAWIQESVGVDWVEMGWDRAAHAAAILNYLSEKTR